MKNSSLFLIILILVSAPTWAAKLVDENRADELCSGAYVCDRETQDPDNRRHRSITQPSNPTPVIGKCGKLPREMDFQARPQSLTCGGDQNLRLRERLAHSQDEIDRNFELLSLGKSDQYRTEAQKTLLKDVRWTHTLKIPVQEHWVYKRKVGGYVDCRGYLGAEGGEPESFQTTCYRRNRKERVIQKVIVKEKYCAEANPPPALPPTPDPEPTYSPSTPSQPRKTTPSSSGTYSPSASGGGTYKPSTGDGGTYKPSNPKPVPQQPKRGTGERESDDKRRIRKGFNSSNDENQLFSASRFPAITLRRIADDVSTVEGDTPIWGCARWDTRIKSSEDIETLVDAVDLEYTCSKTRYKWCTWYVDDHASQSCPEEKTAEVTIKYQTPSDWNPSNSKYDDQLPNGFDLLLGESELIKIKLDGGTTLTPSISISNGDKAREKNWYEYDIQWSPSSLNCDYKNQTITAELTPKGRNVQNAPNPLIIPTDDQGNIQAFSGEDSKGRPQSLMLINPGRSMVLDRSNLSRILGDDLDPNQKVTDIKTDPSLKKAGITRKFWENTRFWMRIVWMDGDTKVKITRYRKFDINKASPEGDKLDISLTGQNGMEPFYRMAVPFEDIFGFLGGDVPFDPKKNYFIEIKVAQPGFDGIYLSGLNDDPTLSDEEKLLMNDGAYSESKLIPFNFSSKRSLLEIFWDWRARRMGRP